MGGKFAKRLISACVLGFNCISSYSLRAKFKLKNTLKIAHPALILAAALLVNIQMANGQARTWVFFRDKGYTSPDQIQQALTEETDRLLQATRARLAKVRAAGGLLTETDLPVCSFYVQEIERLTGMKPHAVCRSVNAASLLLNRDQMAQIEALQFVLKTKPVFTFRQPLGLEESQSFEPPDRQLQDSLVYGTSYLQNALENFPPAHEAGYTGAGVLVGMLDAGWNNLSHVCFDSLEIIATWDFVNGDSSVANDPGQMGEGSHGTKTLSCLAGYDRQNLIGTAYGIAVALAKTENTQYEQLIEEDNWAAGIEWLDSLGCVIATSSLSYPALHTYPELNGDSTIVTIAADNAVARGMIVVNSAGNHGLDPYPLNKMGPPADGDSVLAIGAANSDSTRASFSSIGPTYDGRIKPDLMALGVYVKVASPSDTTSYQFGSGTSFSTPITAGACALLLQADPTLTPMEVHAFLKASATQSLNPDTLMGWGIYDVWQAIQEALGIEPNYPGPITPQKFQIVGIYPNPFNPNTRVVFDLPAMGRVCLSIYNSLGRQMAYLEPRDLLPGRQALTLSLDGLSSGVYWVQLQSPWGIQIAKVAMIK